MKNAKIKMQNYNSKFKNILLFVIPLHFALLIFNFGFEEAGAAIPAKPTVGDIIRVTWNDAIRPAIIFLFVLATVVFLWGLIEFIAKADSEEGRSTGKKHIVWGTIGMAIMFAAGALMTILDNFFKSL